MELKFSRFVDLMMARLYELERDKPGEYIPLQWINQQLAAPSPQSWVFDAGKVLESRGLARCIFTLGGCQAQLTGEGRMFVEEEQGSGVIKEYHERPETFIVNVSGSGNQVSVGGNQSGINQTMTVEQERQPVFDVLKEMEQKVKQIGRAHV